MSSSEKEIWNNLIEKIGQPLKSDDELLRESDKASMKLHNVQYDHLLISYVDNVKESFQRKKFYKEFFFWTSVLILILTFVMLVVTVIVSISKEFSKDLVAVLIPISVSFLTVFIVIPHTITKYLFNEQEEDNMSKVIGNIQEYDKEIRRNLLEQNNK